MLASALLLALHAAAAEPVASFRGDGTGHVQGATVPAAWSKASALWVADAPAWSNATPVVIGERVCALAEPHTTFCLDARTGRLLWQAESTVGDGLPLAEAAAWRKERDAAIARTAEAERLQAEFSRLRRELRRAPGDPALAASLEDTSRRLSALREQVETERPRFFTPEDRDIIGYTTHSPISDGARIYALFGHGVVSAFTPEGRRAWSTWLGPAPPTMRGHHVGTAATPILVDGLLVVGHARLTALDPATGRVVWQSVPYRDYGTPAAVKVGSTWVVATPDGQLVRARDGEVLQTGLPDPWFVGPHVVGDTLYYVGGHTSSPATQKPPTAAAVRLREVAPGQVRGERLWTTTLTGAERFYVPPTHHGGSLLTVDTLGQVWRIDRASGKAEVVLTARIGTAYASPIVVGDRLIAGGDGGLFVVLDAADPSRILTTAELEPMRSTPVPVGDRTYVRTLGQIWCLGGRK